MIHTDETTQQIERLQAVVDNLNSMVAERNATITSLTAEIKSLQTSLEAAEQQRDLHAEQALKVAELQNIVDGLTVENMELASSRALAWEEMARCRKVHDDYRRASEAERNRLIKNAPRALLHWIVRRVRRGKS